MKRLMAWIALIGFVVLFVNLFFLRKFVVQSTILYVGILVYYLVFNLNRNHDKPIIKSDNIDDDNEDIIEDNEIK
jgi:hypothetical protein